MVNSDWAVNSVSHCEKLSKLTVWLTVRHVLTDLLTLKHSAWLVAVRTWLLHRWEVWLCLPKNMFMFTETCQIWGHGLERRLHANNATQLIMQSCRHRRSQGQANWASASFAYHCRQTHEWNELNFINKCSFTITSSIKHFTTLYDSLKRSWNPIS